MRDIGLNWYVNVVFRILEMKQADMLCTVVMKEIRFDPP